ncbi:MAG: hypothetical protein WAS51_14420 [Ilumatobacteraceae bacterium]
MAHKIFVKDMATGQCGLADAPCVHDPATVTSTETYLTVATIGQDFTLSVDENGLAAALCAPLKSICGFITLADIPGGGPDVHVQSMQIVGNYVLRLTETDGTQFNVQLGQVSTVAGNLLSQAADGKPFVNAATVVTALCTDPYGDQLAECLVSSDAGNALTEGSDGRLYTAGIPPCPGAGCWTLQCNDGVLSWVACPVDCSAVMASADGQAREQYFRTAGVLNTETECEGPWGLDFLGSINSGGVTHVVMGFPALQEAVSGSTVDGRPTLKASILAASGGDCEITVATDTIVTDLAFSSQHFTNAEIAVRTGTIIVGCSTAAGTTATFRTRNNMHGESAFWMWPGQEGPGADVTTAPHAGYNYNNNGFGAAGPSVQTPVTMTVNPGDKIGFAYVIWDPAADLDVVFEVDLGAGFVQITSAAEFAAIGWGLDSNV